jgi:hypothetical protein
MEWSWAFVFDLESRAVEKIKVSPEHVENREEETCSVQT